MVPPCTRQRRADEAAESSTKSAGRLSQSTSRVSAVGWSLVVTKSNLRLCRQTVTRTFVPPTTSGDGANRRPAWYGTRRCSGARYQSQPGPRGGEAQLGYSRRPARVEEQDQQ